MYTLSNKIPCKRCSACSASARILFPLAMPLMTGLVQHGFAAPSIDGRSICVQPIWLETFPAQLAGNFIPGMRIRMLHRPKAYIYKGTGAWPIKGLARPKRLQHCTN